MSAKQGTHKCSVMIKNIYGCQMHSLYVYYCLGQSLLAHLFNIVIIINALILFGLYILPIKVV